jgi:hypothetical protein
MLRLATILIAGLSLNAAAQLSVPLAAPAEAKPHAFHDVRYGVRFTVPPGWDLTTKDRQVSTFRLDAHSAKITARMRAVASLGFNPFPQSTLSGALLYYSVEPHSSDRDCEVAAVGKDAKTGPDDIQSIGGVHFTHGHEEHGRICLESRDDIYTTFRKGSCYRFDLAVNMFCSEVSGAQEITLRQMNDIEAQMAGILSTVSLSWSETGAQPVNPPEIVPLPNPAHAPSPAPKPSAKTATPTATPAATPVA